MNTGDLKILYENGPTLAINKESGILTQAPYGIESLERLVKQYINEKEGRGENGYIGTPHRLDRVASGVILFAKHSRATKRLSEQFEARTIDKTYWVCVEGNIEEDSGTWIDYMKKIPDKAKAELAQPIDPDAREAILQYSVLERKTLQTLQKEPFALQTVTFLEIKLETGRMHQIRLQTSSRGFPILGDWTYGSVFPFGEEQEDERQRPAALHARRIRFCDPMTREPIEIVAPLPKRWETIGLTYAGICDASAK